MTTTCSMSMAGTGGGTGRSGGRRLRFGLLASLGGSVLAVVIIGAGGITVVPDSQVASIDLAGNPTFNAKQFVDSLWASHVLPLMRDRATDVGVVLDAWTKDQDAAGRRYGHRPAAGDGPWNFIVRGEGQIKSADMQSRHATLTVDTGGHDVVLQVGPVVFGSALRDSLPFVSFAQVQNQIQFAQLSRELNDRASAAARAEVDISRLMPGAHVSFTGAMAATQPPQVTVMALGTAP